MHPIHRICVFAPVLLALVWAPLASSQEQPSAYGLELTGSWGTGAVLGSWQAGPAPYAFETRTSEEVASGPFQLTDLRATVEVGGFQVVARAEQTPELARYATSSVNITGGHGTVVPYTLESEQLTTMRSVDIGLARQFALSSSGFVTPSISASYLRGSSSLHVDCPQGEGIVGDCSIADREGRVGLALGLRASWDLSASTEMVGDLVSRWAPGETRSTTRFETGQTVGGSVVPISEETHQTRSMFGADLGLRWHASPAVGLTAGWRYREWHFDTGPGSIHGPFVRVSIRS